MNRHDSISKLTVSEATKARNPGLFESQPRPGGTVVSKHDSQVSRQGAVGKKRLRQDSKPRMNKLEERFYLEKLMLDYREETVLIQAVRLELARGIWYKPDFFLPAAFSRMPSGAGSGRHRGAIAYEVKGPKVFRGGFENLKVAARVHTWCRFFLVWQDEDDGSWQRQEVLP